MQIRPATLTDYHHLRDIDGTIETSAYVHVDKSGEGLSTGWKLLERPLRQKRVDPNPLPEEADFFFKQVVIGADEGLALVAEHNGITVASGLAQMQPASGVMHLLDLRVDFDYRRQGLGSALLYQIIAQTRQQQLRALMTQITTGNFPAIQFLLKCGFEIGGLDLYRRSNHDLVKEDVSLFCYLSLN